MTLKVMSCAPRVFEIQNFLSQAEVDHILDLAQEEDLHLSATGESGAETIEGESEIKNTRTSFNSWLEREKSPIVDSIYRRSADLLRIDEALLRRRGDGEHPDFDSDKTVAESLQLVHYEGGQEYTAHHDFGYSAVDSKWQNARFATLLFYLNEGMVGGTTEFPRWVNAETFYGLEAVPEVGKVSFYETTGRLFVPMRKVIDNSLFLLIPMFFFQAVLFYSQLPDGNYDDFSQHAATPVTEGEKWLINVRRPCSSVVIFSTV
jgi:prolyl 4-hydroxylase